MDMLERRRILTIETIYFWEYFSVRNERKQYFLRSRAGGWTLGGFRNGLLSLMCMALEVFFLSLSYLILFVIMILVTESR